MVADLWFGSFPMSLVSRLRSANKNTSMMDKEAFLAGIDYLDLSGMRLSKIPAFVKDLKNLKSLDLSANFIGGEVNGSSFPDGLSVLNLSNNSVTGFDFGAFSEKALKNLESVDLSNNRVLEVPRNISQAESLNILLLKGNELSGVREGFKVPKNLLRIDLSFNHIDVITTTKGAFGNCIDLDISFNSFKRFPESLKTEKLQIVNISGNQLEDWDFMNYGLPKRMNVKA